MKHVNYQNKCKDLKTDVKSRIDTIYESIYSSDEDTIETILNALKDTKNKEASSFFTDPSSKVLSVLSVGIY